MAMPLQIKYFIRKHGNLTRMDIYEWQGVSQCLHLISTQNQNVCLITDPNTENKNVITKVEH